MSKAITNGSESHERIFLFFPADRIEDLVPAQIQGSNSNGQGVGGFDNLPVLLKLLIFGRNFVFSKKNRLRTKQPHTLASMPMGLPHFVGRIGVGKKNNLFTVLGQGRQRFLLLKQIHHFFPAQPDLAITEKSGLRWVDNGNPLEAIDQNRISIRKLLRHLPQTDDGGNTARSSHDHGMTGSSPRIRCNAEDLAFVKRSSVRRAQIFRYQNPGFVQKGCPRSSRTNQISKQTLENVLHVGRAFA